VVPVIVVQKTWGDPNATPPASGTVRFDLTGQLIVGGEAISPQPAIAKLVAAAINQPLTPTYGIEGQETTPALYQVAEAIQGAPVRRYAIQVPAAPPGSRSVADGVAVQGEATVTSATADFTDDDLGLVLWSPAFPVGATILDVGSSTSATLSAAALVSATDQELLIGAQVELTSLDPITQA
jgi:hypothetical protein